MKYGNSKTGKARTGWENFKWRIGIAFSAWMVATVIIIFAILTWRTHVDHQYSSVGDAAQIHGCIFLGDVAADGKAPGICEPISRHARGFDFVIENQRHIYLSPVYAVGVVLVAAGIFL